MKNEANSSSLPLEALVAEVQASAKYRTLSEDLIRRLGARELAVRRNLKEAVKETKNTLHQVAGAFLDRKMRYDVWLVALSQALETSESLSDPDPAGILPEERSETPSLLKQEALQSRDAKTRTGEELGAGALRKVCADIMANHASTRERLPLLETFYTQTLARVQPVRSVLDVCCGLDPLALPWMPLAPDATYAACDLYGDMMTFLNRFFALAGIAGRAQVCDVVGSPPTQAVHVALLLKALPPLEQTDKTSALHLLRALQAEHILVSFPTRTLGGRNKQMGGNYETRFRALVAEETWELERFEFANELCFLIHK